MNTDFIDNSAGVDTSDHEVNIKILLADAIRDGAVPGLRHELLNEMTDEVASLVLRHNYGQNMALAVARSPGTVPAARAHPVPAQADQGQAGQPGTGRAAGRARRSPSAGRRAAA